MTGTEILEVFAGVLARLEQGGISYMVVGSVGSIIYGEPRMTKDMDIVVESRPEIAASFEELFPIEEFYCPPQEILRDEIVNHGQFNLIHHRSGMKIDVIVKACTAHAQSEFARRQKVEFWKDMNAFVATPEDIIIKKLQYYKEGGSDKHIRDIRGIIANHSLDKIYLDKWVAELKLQTEWSAVGR